MIPDTRYPVVQGWAMRCTKMVPRHGAMACIQDAKSAENYLYPHDIRPCSIEQVMPDHRSLLLLARSLLVGDFPRVERQLCVSPGRFAFG